jgi:hypothetical protein
MSSSACIYSTQGILQCPTPDPASGTTTTTAETFYNQGNGQNRSQYTSYTGVRKYLNDQARAREAAAAASATATVAAAQSRSRPQTRMGGRVTPLDGYVPIVTSTAAAAQQGRSPAPAPVFVATPPATTRNPPTPTNTLNGPTDCRYMDPIIDPSRMCLCTIGYKPDPNMRGKCMRNINESPINAETKILMIEPAHQACTARNPNFPDIPYEVYTPLTNLMREMARDTPTSQLPASSSMREITTCRASRCVPSFTDGGKKYVLVPPQRPAARPDPNVLDIEENMCTYVAQGQPTDTRRSQRFSYASLPRPT